VSGCQTAQPHNGRYEQPVSQSQGNSALVEFIEKGDIVELDRGESLKVAAAQRRQDEAVFQEVLAGYSVQMSSLAPDGSD
jgi:hypothetical protein